MEKMVPMLLRYSARCNELTVTYSTRTVNLYIWNELVMWHDRNGHSTIIVHLIRDNRIRGKGIWIVEWG